MIKYSLIIIIGVIIYDLVKEYVKAYNKAEGPLSSIIYEGLFYKDDPRWKKAVLMLSYPFIIVRVILIAGLIILVSHL